MKETIYKGNKIFYLQILFQKINPYSYFQYMDNLKAKAQHIFIKLLERSIQCTLVVISSVQNSFSEKEIKIYSKMHVIYTTFKKLGYIQYICKW